MPTLLMFVDGRVTNLTGYPEVLQPLEMAVCQATARSFNLPGGIKDVGLLRLQFSGGVNCPNIMFLGFASKPLTVKNPQGLIETWERDVTAALVATQGLDQCKDFFQSLWRIEFQAQVGAGSWAELVLGRGRPA
ncbi:MAG: hypothetical protein QG639_910 [Patescibacteria group bacterium]|nr:hypothetical protein [Patescibacteria group bacterium]